MGLLSTAVARVSKLRRSSAAPGANALSSVPIEEVLAALPPDAPAELVQAIQSGGCCIHYYVAESSCGSGGCGTGRSCYHIVSSCGPDYYSCLDYPCSKGNFSTGC
jgi:hypothetical protein